MTILHCMYSYTVLIYLTGADNPVMKMSNASGTQETTGKYSMALQLYSAALVS